MDRPNYDSEKHILVVDDDADILALLRETLGATGCEVDTALSPVRAIELIRNNIYDAALIDFDLPGMNGVMLHREIRLMDPDLARRTIFMSGQVEAQNWRGYYDSEGAAFLPKPFDLRALVATVSALSGVPVDEIHTDMRQAV